ncbi:MAG: TPM domain-containing protein [Lachnospiraceae bacterium]
MKQYFSYFKFLFITLGVVAVLTGLVGIIHMTTSGNYTRYNSEAPDQRVFDYADVLSDEEEENLEELIAKRESQIGCDIVLVIIDASLYDLYGITEDTDSNWEYVMMNYADDFYDQNNYGFNKVHGDGALILHNWNPVEKGSWLSTCGRVMDHYTYSMIDDVTDELYGISKSEAYQSYRAAIEVIYREMAGKNSGIQLNAFVLFIISAVAAGIFIGTHMKVKEGDKTTTASTYVENGSVKFNVQKDELINKFVTSRRIETSSGSGGGGHSGGAGSHHSSGGVSHGGGGRRG